MPRKEDGMSDIREHMKIIGKDGVHVGTVGRVEGQPQKAPCSSPEHGVFS